MKNMPNQSHNPLSKFAVFSFILGIIALMPVVATLPIGNSESRLAMLFYAPLTGLVPGLIAVILGAMAKSKIRKGIQSGKVLSTAGITMGICGILFVAYLVIRMPFLFILPFIGD